jgi:hypothetical protein
MGDEAEKINVIALKMLATAPLLRQKRPFRFARRIRLFASG